MNYPNIIFIVPLMLAACSRGGVDEQRSSLPEKAVEGEAEPAAGQADTPQTERGIARVCRIIREGLLEFETDDLAKTRVKLDQAIAHHRATVVSDVAENLDSRTAVTLVIRVPAERFDALVAAVSAGVTDFVVRNLSAKDVTEEYVDIQARLKVKKEIEGRYAELLAQATTVKDILAIEKQAGEIRAEIESIEGRLRYLENRVALSTLTVTAFTPVASTLHIGVRFKMALSEGWNGFIRFLVGLAYLWPFLLLGSVVFVLVRFIRRRRKQAPQRNQPEPPPTDQLRESDANQTISD